MNKPLALEMEHLSPYRPLTRDFEVFFRHAYVGCFFLNPEDVVNLSNGVIWNFGKGTGLL
jgi:hypothetical protein